MSWARLSLRGGYLTRRAYALPHRGAGLNLEEEANAARAAFLRARGTAASARDIAL